MTRVVLPCLLIVSACGPTPAVECSTPACDGGLEQANVLDGFGAFPISSASAFRLTSGMEAIGLSPFESGAQACGDFGDLLGVNCMPFSDGGFEGGALVTLTLASRFGGAVGAGTYPVCGSVEPSPGCALVDLMSPDDAGLSFAESASGTVTLGRTGDIYAGSFTVKLNEPGGSLVGTLSGTFSANACVQ